MKGIAVQGFKYDEKSSYQKGPRLAPPLIRKALYSDSMNLYSEDVISIENSELVEKGDFEVKNYFEIEDITKNHLTECSKIFTLGGDHSITFPIVKALHTVYTKIDILHIDAHTDLYDEYDGDPYSHACPFARIMEAKLAVKLVQIGIRTLNPHQKEQSERFNVEIHEMKDLDFKKIPEFKNPLYISLDMDAFDPAFAPGVSHHEPGGLSSRQVIKLIQQIDTDVIGADIVEYNPTKDIHEMTAFLAAKMMKEILVKMI